MKSVYELESEQVELLGKIKELEEIAITDVDKRELKRLRKRSFEIQDDLLVAKNKEKLAGKENIISNIKEAGKKNSESYTRMIQLAEECLPKLKDVYSLLEQIAVSQDKLVYSGREANDEARRVKLQFGDDVTVNVKSLPLIGAITSTDAIKSYIEKLELLLKENKEKVKEDAKVSTK